jgi:L-amino acid N-acyltransferase YncA
MPEPLNPLIRSACPGDVPAITEIYADAVTFGTASFEVEPPDAAEMERRLVALTSRGLPYLIAEAAGRVCGYAYAAPYRTRIAYRFTLEDSIYVAPAVHGSGIGRALLDGLLSRAEALGYRQMVAVIGDSEQAPSIALHRAAGFRLVGTFESVGYKFGRWLDTVLMQRALGPGATVAPSKPR